MALDTWKFRVLGFAGLVGLGLMGLGAGCEKDGSSLSNENDLTGIWEGSASFTHNCANPGCFYQGAMHPPSVTLDLLHINNRVDGTATLDLPQGEAILDGVECNPLYGQLEIFDGTVDGTRLTLTSYSGGSEIVWDLVFTSDLLRGSYTATATGCNALISDDVVLSRK